MFRDTRSRPVGDITEGLDAALRDPVIYPHPVERIEVEETHISKVFLTGPFVYKVKKPVDFGFLDCLDPGKAKALVRTGGAVEPAPEPRGLPRGG